MIPGKLVMNSEKFVMIVMQRRFQDDHARCLGDHGRPLDDQVRILDEYHGVEGNQALPIDSQMPDPEEFIAMEGQQEIARGVSPWFMAQQSPLVPEGRHLPRVVPPIQG